jgi:hypothetical protein
MNGDDVDAESDVERWLAPRGLGGMADAACLTFVRGRDRDEILSTFGAELDRPTLTLTEALEDVVTCIGVLAWGDGFLAIEPNGGEGLRPGLLRELSREGAAASLFWDVNGTVVLSCASRGRTRGSEELLDLNPDSQLPRAVLGALLAARDSGGESLVAALDAVAQFVGLPSDIGELPPPTLYRLVPQLEDLPDDIYPRRSLEHDGPALLDLVDNASPAAQRRTAEWIASWTMAHVGLADDPRAIHVLSQFGRDRSTSLGPALGLVVEVHRRTSLLQATDASRFGGEAAPAMRAAWMQDWAIRALRWTTVSDPATAALGAIECLRPFMRTPAPSDAHSLHALPDIAGEVAAVTELVRPLLTEQHDAG